MKRIVLLTLLSLALVNYAIALMEVVSPYILPPPWTDHNRICHPAGNRERGALSSVCDPSGLLSKRQISNLDSLTKQIYSGISPYSIVDCPGHSSNRGSKSHERGFHVAIAIVRRMVPDGNTASVRAKQFTTTVFRNWHLSENCGASVLIFVSLDDRRMFIKTGVFGNKYFKDKDIDTVYSKIVPMFSQNKVFDALHLAVVEIGVYLSKYNGKKVNQNSDERTWLAKPLFFRHWPAWWDLELSILSIIFAAFTCIACCNGCGGREATSLKRDRKEVMRKLDLIRIEFFDALNERYIPKTCPFCQGDLPLPWEAGYAQTSSTSGTEALNGLNGDTAALPRVTTRTLTCGHVFHANCFNEEYSPSSNNPSQTCPICNDSSAADSDDEGIPKNLKSSRLRDVSFRIQRLHDEYSHILSQEVVAKLEAEPPNLWPSPMTESYIKSAGRSRFLADEEGEDRSGIFWGGLGTVLAAGGIGALAGSMFSNWGRNNSNNEHEQSYSNIPGGQAVSSGDSGGGGHVAWWGGNVPNATGAGHGATLGGDGANSGGGGHGAIFGGGGGHGASFGGGGGHGASFGSDGDGGGLGTDW